MYLDLFPEHETNKTHIPKSISPVMSFFVIGLLFIRHKDTQIIWNVPTFWSKNNDLSRKLGSGHDTKGLK